MPGVVGYLGFLGHLLHLVVMSTARLVSGLHGTYQWLLKLVSDRVLIVIVLRRWLWANELLFPRVSTFALVVTTTT